MLRRRLPSHVLGILILVTAQGAAATPDLPYNPTRIFHDNSSSYAYILQPDTESNGQAQLLSVDVSQSLEASSLSPTTLFSSLPFLDQDSEAAILPVIDDTGNITVVSGNCSSETGPQIWTFAPDSEGKKGNGTWTQRTLSSQETAAGIQYLNNGVAFSEKVAGNSSNTNIYMFGGMCPFANATEDTWTTSANYTNHMLEYAAAKSSSGGISYTSEAIAMRGPPVAEAGFSMTPLVPSYSADTSDATQQQSFVLIGGHTNGAFINMSQVALFSLPLQSWTFIGVDAPSSSSSVKTDLAVRSSSNIEVEPRSGHTAVLSEDGNSIIVFGGWVGDVSTPATPQLAVLELGSGYGGTGDWAWSVPSSGSANLSGAGLYGHGALMLPGGVMMLSGGYSIPTASGSSRMFRRATTTSNSQTLFYNVTSSSWVSTYSPPASALSGYSSLENSQKSSTLSTPGQKAGLGVGLVVGVILLVGLVVYYFWYSRRLKRKRENRMSDKEGLMRRSDTFGNPWYGQPSIDGRGGASSAGALWNEKAEPTSSGYSTLPQNYNEQPLPDSRREVERSGVMVNVPSPTRGLRKNGPTRAQYQYHAAPRYDDGRISRSSGHIHPIEERDEEEDRTSIDGRPLTPTEQKLRDIEKLLRGNDNTKTSEDPFQDPPPNPLRSHPVSPEIGPPVGSTMRRSITNATNATNVSAMTNATDQVSSWISQWTASYAAAMRPTSDNPASNSNSTTTSSGRCSPTKTDERTSSNLSEASNRSGISAGASSMGRTSSTRSALFFGLSGRPSITPQVSPVDATFTNVPTMGRSRSPLHSEYRSQSGQHLAAGTGLSRPGAQRTSTADSYSTAGTTWGQLMEQGEALLGSANPTAAKPQHSNHSSRDTIAPLNYPKRRISATQQQRQQQYPHDQSDSYLLANAGPTPPIPPRRRLGWMGSLRRALGTHDRSFSSAAPLNPHHTNPNNVNSGLPQHYHDHIATIRSNSTSPSKSRPGAHSAASSHGPRRTASDSSEFLRLKRGRRDWEGDIDEEDPRWTPYRDDPPSPDCGDWGEDMVVPEIMIQRYYDVDKPLPPITGPNGVNRKRPRAGSSSAGASAGPATRRGLVNSGMEMGGADAVSGVEGDDWDIESAIAKRDVQVMFTLPKARLRVVNADPDSLSQRSVSGGSTNTPVPTTGPVVLSTTHPATAIMAAAKAASSSSSPSLPEGQAQAQEQEAPRSPSQTPSLESFRTARAGTGQDSNDNSARGSAETVRKASNYSAQIMDWEREALELRDREEQAGGGDDGQEVEVVDLRRRR